MSDNLNLKISICIPTWENHGYGSFFLEKLLQTISNQSYKNYEVIISDHSENEDIKNLCSSLNENNEIVYVKNINKKGNGPHNTNNSIKNAKGDIIKIMFQDDFFYDENALQKIIGEFENENCNWLVCGCNHTYDDGKTFTRFMIPEWNENILFGVNTISSPSVLAFRNGNEFYFDENLTMLMDCEIYYQLYIKYGLPKTISDYLISNRIHQNQISSLYQGDMKNEIDYVKKKYNL